MAKKISKLPTNKKKTGIGQGKFSKFGNKGGGQGGSTISPRRRHRKPDRGQGS